MKLKPIALAPSVRSTRITAITMATSPRAQASLITMVPFPR